MAQSAWTYIQGEIERLRWALGALILALALLAIFAPHQLGTLVYKLAMMSAALAGAHVAISTTWPYFCLETMYRKAIKTRKKEDGICFVGVALFKAALYGAFLIGVGGL